MASDDPVWDYCMKINNNNDLMCLVCKKTYKGYKVKRMKEHLAGQGKDVARCKNVTETVRELMLKNLNDAESRSKVGGAGDSDDSKKELGFAIGRFFIDAGIPFEMVDSPYFQPLLDIISSQPPKTIAPSFQYLQGSIFKDEEVLAKCEKYGCSILLDQWTENGKTFVNFSVSCCEELVLLNSFGQTEITNTCSHMFTLLKEVIEKIGAKNVVQIVAKNDDCYKDVIEELGKHFPNIFWTSCAVDCIDLILKDFKMKKWIHQAIEEAKRVTKFIYNHETVFQLMKMKTDVTQILIMGPTSNSADFFTLKRLLALKDSLGAMVHTIDWIDIQETNNEEGEATRKSILDADFWTKCSKIIQLVNPLLSVLKSIYKRRGSKLGYVFASVYHTKSMLKEELPDYKDYWTTIDKRCKILHLHVACFYLDPKLLKGSTELIKSISRSSFYSCLERFGFNSAENDNILLHIDSYHTSRGDFGRELAKNSSHPPDVWWSLFGAHGPELLHVALRILTQPCSLVGFKPKKVHLQQLEDKSFDADQQKLNLKIKKRFYGKDFLDTVKEWVHEENVDDRSWSNVDPKSFDEEDLETLDVLNDDEILEGGVFDSV